MRKFLNYFFNKTKKTDEIVLDEIETEYRYRDELTDIFCLYLDNIDFENDFKNIADGTFSASGYKELLFQIVEVLKEKYKHNFESLIYGDGGICAFLFIDALENIDFTFAILNKIEELHIKITGIDYEYVDFYCKDKETSKKVVNIQTRLFIERTEEERRKIRNQLHNKELYQTSLKEFLEELIEKYIDSVSSIYNLKEIDQDFIDWILYYEARQIDMNIVSKYDFGHFDLDCQFKTIEEMLNEVEQQNEATTQNLLNSILKK